MSEVLRMVKKLADGSADVLGVFGGLSALAGNLKKVTKETKSGTASTETLQELPGAFGLSLKDERLIAGVLCQLKVKEQLLITDFLTKKCKNFQRKRFIEVVSGLEVTPGVPEKSDWKWDNQTKRNIAVMIPAVPGKDRRQEFLENFAKILGDPTKASKAFDYVVGARTILKDSVSDMFKKEACKIRKERNVRNELPKKKPYKGFWATAISFERNKRRKP